MPECRDGNPWFGTHQESDDTWFYGLMTQCSYNYRGNPCTLGWRDIAYSDGPHLDQPSPYNNESFMLLTKPMIPAQAGSAMFRTSKHLGGRAIVTDTWSWDNVCSTSIDPNWGGTYGPDPRNEGNRVAYPAYGQYAHRVGYNVLYGDWSASWYDDADEDFLWPTWIRCPNYYWNHLFDLDRNVIMKYVLGDGSRMETLPAADLQWHIFDVNHGIDTDVAPGWDRQSRAVQRQARFGWFIVH